MFTRRTLLIALALPPVMAGCRLFKPYNPNAPKAEKAEKPAAAAPVQTAAQPAAQTAAAPVDFRVTRSQLGRIKDPNVAAMLLASNNTDISYARLVPTRAERADIKEFAQRMLTDHVGVNGLVNDLLKQLDIAAEDNELSLDMRDESANKRDMMRELSGYAFDSTYIENEVSYHQRFLASIDQAMIPRARNSKLKDLLTVVRPAVAAHLAHAEQVRANVISKK